MGDCTQWQWERKTEDGTVEHKNFTPVKFDPEALVKVPRLPKADRRVRESALEELEAELERYEEGQE